MQNRKLFAKPITIRLTKDDDEFVKLFAEKYGMIYLRALRTILEYSKCYYSQLLKETSMRLVRGSSVQYVNKLNIWVTNSLSDFIDLIAQENAVPKQEAARFLVRLAEYDRETLCGRANFFILN